MADSVYKVIELVGTSTDSWERAAAAAVAPTLAGPPDPGSYPSRRAHAPALRLGRVHRSQRQTVPTRGR